MINCDKLVCMLFMCYVMAVINPIYFCVSLVATINL